MGIKSTLREFQVFAIGTPEFQTRQQFLSEYLSSSSKVPDS